MCTLSPSSDPKTSSRDAADLRVASARAAALHSTVIRLRREKADLLESRRAAERQQEEMAATLEATRAEVVELQSAAVESQAERDALKKDHCHYIKRERDLMKRYLSLEEELEKTMEEKRTNAKVERSHSLCRRALMTRTV